ncbi:MAG: hypothetical protein AB1403_15195 [Candidatus Riflebacteria bacterium]
MSRLPRHMIHRMIFMFCVMFPVLLYAEYTGTNSVILAGLAGGVSSGVSVVLFPSDEQMKKNSQERKDEE